MKSYLALIVDVLVAVSWCAVACSAVVVAAYTCQVAVETVGAARLAYIAPVEYKPVVGFGYDLSLIHISEPTRH